MYYVHMLLIDRFGSHVLFSLKAIDWSIFNHSYCIVRVSFIQLSYLLII